MSVELWNSRPRVSPADQLLALSEECAKLNIQACDVYGDFESTPDQSYLRRFESEIAATFGKEDALFLPSGVMAQQISLLIHFHAASAQKANVDRSFVCHQSSHILIHEKDTCNYLLNMKPLIVAAKENTNVQTPLSYDEVAEKLSSADANPCAVVLECPHREIGGKCTPYEDLEKISQLCRQRGIAFHMDGARLWEAIAHYTTCTTASGAAVTAHDLCALFDSIYVSCYKGIGGMTGAVLLGTRTFIAEARVWLRRFGGNVFTLLPYAVSSYSCYRNYVKWNATLSEESTASANGTEGALSVPYAMADRLKRMQSVVALLSTEDAGLRPYVRFDPPVPQVCLIHVYIRADAALAMKAHARSLQDTGIACFARLRPAAPVLGDQAHTFPQESYFEFNMGVLNGVISDEVWLCGWRAFVKELQVECGADAK